MDRVSVNLKHCYGIKALKHDFDFTEKGAYAIYAPNGSMKSSLAKTFQDLAEKQQPRDRIFSDRITTCRIVDESGVAIDGARVFVFGPVDEKVAPSAKTSTLLVNAALRSRHEKLRADIETAKTTLVAALKKQSGTKTDIEAEISLAIVRRPNSFETAMGRIQAEIQAQADAPFAQTQYDKIFNDAVIKAISSEDVMRLIEQYTTQYNKLLESSIFFKKGTFDYYNAGEIAKSLESHGFFKAKHTVRLNGIEKVKEVSDQKELKAIIEEEKAAIFSDLKLRKSFDDVFTKLHTNKTVRDFADYISQPGNEPILSRMDNIEGFRQDVFKSYVKSNEGAYTDLMQKIDAARAQEAELRTAAAQEQTRWITVINIFNDRFVVPFRLEMKNYIDMVLGQQSVPALGFTYIDGEDETPVEQDRLLGALSMGERKAFYILNVMFEIETRIQLQEETLVIVDDVADSFDYQNKYAIIQYLKDITEQTGKLFKEIILTHNFDFFRTISTRFVGRGHCLMATKTNTGIVLNVAMGVENIFVNDWKKNFFKDNRKKVASIPFLRNLIEFTVGKSDANYQRLTSMLHWKADSRTLTVGDLDNVFNELCKPNGVSTDPARIVCELIDEAADECVPAPSGLNFENKIVLAIAVRMKAEKFMVRKIGSSLDIDALKSNQTYGLLTLFKTLFGHETEALAILDRVSLVTPENIHLNSFMYEPIVDMSDDQLKKLWKEVKGLG